MTDRDVNTMSDKELKDEHRGLQGRLNTLREDRRTYENDSLLGQNAPARGEREQMDEIDREMDEIRRRQREIYQEFQNRRSR